MSDYTKTPNLGLDIVTYAGFDLRQYDRRIELEQRLSASLAYLDVVIGTLTGSFVTTAFCSGAVGDWVGTGGPGVGGKYAGMFVADSDRIITKISILQRNSGSGGVTVVDARLASGALPDASNSIFANAVFRPKLSGAVDGDGAVREAATIVAASASWKRGWTLGLTVDSGNGGGTVSQGKDLYIHVHWKPSSSFYGAGLTT